MSKRTLILIRVNEQAEQFYEKSQELGTLAMHTFLEGIEPHKQHKITAEKEKKEIQKHRAQLTGLENIADTTLKVTDVLDYIKKQIARQEGWKKEHAGKRFGESLKHYIENDLKKTAEDLCVDLKINTQTDEGKRDRQYIHLQLARQLIRQIVVHYEYCVSQREEEVSV